MLHNIYTLQIFYIHIARKEKLYTLFHIRVNGKILITDLFNLCHQKKNPDNIFKYQSTDTHKMKC